MKAVGHIVRSVWAALRPAIDGLDPQQAWRGSLIALREQAVAAVAALPQSAIPGDALARDRRILDATIAMIDRTLAEGLPSLDGLRATVRAVAPALLADATASARLQIDVIDAQVRPWWTTLTEAERARAMAVVASSKAARRGNPIYGYFVNLLGPESAEERVIYAEGVFDLAGARAVLASLLTDRRLSQDVFAAPHRMESDLLSDGAEARLLELFGRLGAR
jgi:hypothetical protein